MRLMFSRFVRLNNDSEEDLALSGLFQRESMTLESYYTLSTLIRNIFF